MADYLLYAATLIPLLLIVLAVHEAGHFWTARRLGMHAAGFQIGLVTARYTRYCGRIKLRLPAVGDPALPCHNRSGRAPAVGDRAALAVQPDSAAPEAARPPPGGPPIKGLAAPGRRHPGRPPGQLSGISPMTPAIGREDLPFIPFTLQRCSGVPFNDVQGERKGRAKKKA